MKKTELKKQWEREQKRLQRLVKKLQSAGIEFDYDPIPRPPKTITEKTVLRLKKIDTDSLLKRRRTKTDEILTGLKQRKQTVQANEPSLKRVTKGDDEIRTPMSPEKRKEIAKKAAETRRKQEQADPELKRKRDEQRRKNIEKAREKLTREQREQNLKKSREKLTPEKRKEIAKKAAETRRKQEQADPELKRKRDEQRRKNIEKARQAKVNKKLEQDKQEQQETVTDTPVKKKEEKQPKSAPEIPVEEKTDDTESIVEYIEETDTETVDREPEIIGVDALTGEAVTEADNSDARKTEYQKLIEQRDEERRRIAEEQSNSAPLNYGETIIDTIRTELQHAVNEDIAEFLESALDDAISYHEVNDDYNEWVQNMSNLGSEVLDRVYNLVDESDGEKVRQSVTAFLVSIYGSWANIPPSALETAEQLTSEFYFKPSNYRSKAERRILRARKIRERFK